MKLILEDNGTYTCPDDPGEAGYIIKEPRRSVTLEEAQILQRAAHGKLIIEIGTGLGVATRAMAVYARQVDSIDPDNWCHSFKFPPNVKLLASIPDYEHDMAFIDGNHKFINVLKDINNVKAGIIFLHDCYLPDIRMAITEAGLLLVKKFKTVCYLESYRKR